MVYSETIYAGKAKQNGVWNFKDLYNFLYDWLIEKGYKVDEEKYLTIVQGNAKQIELKWVATKYISSYFLYEIEMNWILLGMTDIDIDVEGKKIKMNKGTLEINFKSNLVRDPSNQWDNPVFKIFRRIYDNTIIRKRILDHEDIIYEDTDEAINQVKAFLQIEGLRIR